MTETIETQIELAEEREREESISFYEMEAQASGLLEQLYALSDEAVALVPQT